MRFLTIFSAVYALLFISFIYADSWDISAEANLSFNQSFYSDNWAGEELGSISWTATVNNAAEKQLSELFHNRTTLKLAYGQTHQQKYNQEGKKHWGKPEKSTDKIDLESILRFTMQGYVDPFVSARWQSQFLDLRDKDESMVINPNRFTESAGILRNFMKQENHKLSARLGAAFRQTIDRNVLVVEETEEMITYKRETETTYDGGIEFIAEYMKRFLPQDIRYTSRLQVYQALFNSEEDDLPNDYWKAVDLNWEHTLTTRIWSVINAVLFFEMVYEKEEDRSLQYRQTLGLGVFFQLY